MKRDLFICYTPLQVLIAKAIIQSGACGKEKPDFYLFALSESDRYKHYYDDMKSLCNYSELVTSLPRFPLYLKWLRARFKSKTYNQVFFASIDSVHIQYILSIISFESIATFDDGTANITPDSKYYKNVSSSSTRIKLFLRWCFGNRYTSHSMVAASTKHYTLYKDMSNIITNTVPLDIFMSSADSAANGRDGELVVILGTVLKDILKNEETQPDSVRRIAKLLNELPQGDKVYLPHPRDETDYFPDIPRCDSPLIAEEVIINYAKSYKKITLIGFGSSTQFNLMGQGFVHNIVITSSLFKDVFSDLSEMLCDAGADAISID
jgi:beta-galactosamide-alpha-2,3-sialyltransferase